MSYSENLSALMGRAKAEAASAAHRQAQREAEQVSALERVVEAKLVLGAKRAAEKAALKALKRAESTARKVAGERKEALAQASQSQAAVTWGEDCNSLLSQVEHLRADESRLLAMRPEAESLGFAAEWRRGLGQLRDELGTRASQLDSSWAAWHTAVQEMANSRLLETGWKARRRRAFEESHSCKREWLMAKGDVVIALDRLHQAENRLVKVL